MGARVYGLIQGCMCLLHIRGTEDNYGKKFIEASLRELIWDCLNFIKEETILQTNSCNVVERRDHIIVDRTPMFHPKLSGKGIENSWFCTKDYYRRLFDKNKCNKIFR